MLHDTHESAWLKVSVLQLLHQHASRYCKNCPYTIPKTNSTANLYGLCRRHRCIYPQRINCLRACIECSLLCMNSTEFCKMMDHFIAIVANLRGHKKGNAIFVFCLRGIKTTLHCRSAAETTVMDSCMMWKGSEGEGGACEQVFFQLYNG